MSFQSRIIFLHFDNLFVSDISFRVCQKIICIINSFLTLTLSAADMTGLTLTWLTNQPIKVAFLAAACLRKRVRKIFRGVLYGTADEFDQFGGVFPDQGQERLACLERLSSNADYLTPKSSTSSHLHQIRHAQLLDTRSFV